MGSKLRVVSWVLLALVCVLMLWGSLVSARLTYTRGADVLVPGETSVAAVAEWNPGVATAIRARRGTAAAYAAAYSTLLLLVVLVPYRRGEVWSWWAVLAGSVALAILTLLRIPLLDHRPGSSVAVTQLVVVVAALLLDVGRLRRGEKRA